jgi:hypothetical protein
VTAVVNSADHHDQSIGQQSAHSGTLPIVNCNVRCLVKLDVHLYSCFVLFKSSLISVYSSVTAENQTHVHMTVLTVNDPINKILKY